MGWVGSGLATNLASIQTNAQNAFKLHNVQPFEFAGPSIHLNEPYKVTGGTKRRRRTEKGCTVR